MNAIPQTSRERVEHALRVTGWMLQAIDAPKDLKHWPRRDREAWFDVIGRPRITAIMKTMQNREVGDEHTSGE